MFLTSALIYHVSLLDILNAKEWHQLFIIVLFNRYDRISIYDNSILLGQDTNKFLCRHSSNPKNSNNLTCGQISIIHLFAIKLELGIMFNNKIENNKDFKKTKNKKTKRAHTIYVYKICIMAKCGETI